MLHISRIIGSVCFTLLLSISPALAETGVAEAEKKIIVTPAPELSLNSWLDGQKKILTYIQKGKKLRLDAPEQYRVSASQFDFQFNLLQNNICRVAEAVSEAAEKRGSYHEKIFNVKDFGAVGNGIADDGPAIRRAVAAASQYPSSKVFLPPGQYLIADPDPQQVAAAVYRESMHGENITTKDLEISKAAHIVIRQAANLTFSGSGREKTEIIFGTSNVAGVLVSESLQVILRDFSTDYRPLPFTQGRITRVLNGKNFEVKIDEGFSRPDAPQFATNFPVLRLFQDRSEFGVALHNRASTYYIPQEIRPTGDGNWDIRLRDKLPEPDRDARLFSAGERVVIYGRWTRMYTPLKFSACRNCAAVGVDIYSSSSIAINLEMNDLIEISGCRIIPKPGSSRIASTNADGIFAFGNRIGPYVHDSQIRQNGDDFFNFLNVSNAIWQVGPEELTINRQKSQVLNTFRPGDTIAILDGKDYRVKDLVQLKSSRIEKIGDAIFTTLFFTKKLPSNICVEKELNTSAPPDYLVDLNTLNSGSMVCSNLFENGFRMILRCGDALVENNRFVCRNTRGNIAHFGVRRYGFGAEVWTAGNILVINNRFDLSSDWPPFLCPDGGVAKAVNHDITIRENTFITPRVQTDQELQNGFNLEDCENIIIQNNRFIIRRPDSLGEK